MSLEGLHPSLAYDYILLGPWGGGQRIGNILSFMIVTSLHWSLDPEAGPAAARKPKNNMLNSRIEIFEKRMPTHICRTG